ncbi:MAG: ABC transporter permease [Blastocatellia bacterium]|nr:ABC transporter permease [Blastocatellia bacterium]
MMQTLRQDLLFGFRMMRKAPVFTAIAVLSLGLGIGANTSLFSLVEVVLLKTLPVAEPDRLVLFEWQSGRDFRTTGMRGTFIGGAPGTRGGSVFRYDTLGRLQQAWSQSAESPMSDLFAFAPLYELTSVVDEQAEVVFGQAVSGGYFAGLGVRPILGRAITEEDQKPGASPVAVLSHAWWQERFGANPSVVGRQFRLNKTLFTVIGVMPAGFTGALQVNQRPAVTVPLTLEPQLLGEGSAMARAENPGYWWIHLMGRLKPGATREQARDSLNGVFQGAAMEIMPPPRRANDPAKIEPKDYPRLIAQPGSQGTQEIRKLYSRTIYGLFAIVAMVLLIACANVANLLLARAALRGQEISVRLAVGAGRGRLIRQLLTESVLLSMIGGAVGVLFAMWGQSALAAMATRDADFLPTGVTPSLNWRVLGFTVAVSLATGILFGLAPAWRATKLDLTSALKQGQRGSGAVSRLSKSLVVIQVALSLLLLLGAGLFIRTVHNLQKIDLGFNQENLLLFNLQPGQSGYKEERLMQFYEQLFTRLDAMPGVRSATFGAVPLISQFVWNGGVLLPGETEKSGVERIANRQIARENYFATMEIPLLSGRNFLPRDDARAPKVAIVNQTFVQKFFPNENPIGRRIGFDDKTAGTVEIVGIVRDAKYNRQREEMEPLVYTPWRQETDSIGAMYFCLRTLGEPTALASAVRQAVRELDSSLPVTEVNSQKARARETLSQERLYARLLGFFGGMALLLAGIGLSGVLAYSVAQRTNEMGIRMALGAQARDVLRLVIWQGMKLVLLGLAVGAAGGYALKRLLASSYFTQRDWQRQMAEQLYGVSGTDPLTFGLIAGLLLGVALLACWLPARRAARVDPMVALRCD